MSNRKTIACSVLLAGFLLSVANPAQARFLQVDPIGYKGDLNLYAYVGNDPTNKFDPKGLWECSQQGGCDATKSALKVLRNLTPEQRAKLSHSLQNKLDAVLRFYGKDDFDNHVTVNETRGTGSDTHTSNGRTTITLGIDRDHGNVYAIAGVAAHEGQHGIDETQRFRGRDPANAFQQWDSEVRSYTLQAGVNHATNYNGQSSYWDADPDKMQQKLYTGAWDSTVYNYPNASWDPAFRDYSVAHQNAEW